MGAGRTELWRLRAVPAVGVRDNTAAAAAAAIVANAARVKQRDAVNNPRIRFQASTSWRKGQAGPCAAAMVGPQSREGPHGRMRATRCMNRI
jgi:hypothetical protein